MNITKFVLTRTHIFRRISMAKFLDTQAISNEIIQLIKEAKKRIILIAPYFQTSEILRERIKTKSEKSKLMEFTIIYGKEDLKKSESDWMKRINNITILEKKNLHAKCYLNESRAIICSMNLYYYSQQNNIEMGILISKKDDPEAFRSLIEEIDNLKHNSIIKLNNQPPTFNELDLSQKLIYKLIKDLISDKPGNGNRLTEDEIISLACQQNLNDHSVSRLLPEKKFLEHVDGILMKVNYAQKFTIGKVERIIRSDDNSIHNILFLLQNGNKLFLSCTDKKLPKENVYVAVRINETWFNEHICLSE